MGGIKDTLKKLFADNINLGKFMLKTYAGFVCGMCDPACLSGKVKNNSGTLALELSNNYKSKLTDLYKSFHTNSKKGIEDYIGIVTEFYDLSKKLSGSNSTSGFDPSKIKVCQPQCNSQSSQGCEKEVQDFTMKIIDHSSTRGAYCEIKMVTNGSCPTNSTRILALNGQVTFSDSGADPETKGGQQGVNTTKAEAVNGNTQTKLSTNVNFGASGSGGSFGIVMKISIFTLLVLAFIALL